MYANCSKLINSTSILPATTTMINENTSVSQVYYGMFELCTSLQRSPEILLDNPYGSDLQRMFWNCSSLNYIKCLSTIIGSNASKDWTVGVAANGTFVRCERQGVYDSVWTNGSNGIPSGWSVVYNS